MCNRKTFFSSIVFLFLLASCREEWKIYDAKEFTIEFPGLAKDTATLNGDLAGLRTYYDPGPKSLDSNLYYAVSVYTLPDSADKLGNDLDEFFRADVKIYAYTMGGVLADSGRAVKSGKIEGREYKVFLTHQAGTVTIRKFARGKHLYTLLVITSEMCLDNSQIARFMDSFKLK
ncbi:MAG: hypothetical protein HY064_10800 [Bacteroidetes bacterium]|nr:hypothetical protein [Bacteroidota bacterium]